MFDSRVKTINVPVITAPVPVGGQGPSPATIIKTAKDDCVVRVRNNSFSQAVLLAFDAATLSTFPPSGDTFELPAGASEPFVIARGQDLFVATTSGPAEGEGPKVSVHIYQDVPTTGMDS